MDKAEILLEMKMLPHRLGRGVDKLRLQWAVAATLFRRWTKGYPVSLKEAFNPCVFSTCENLRRTAEGLIVDHPEMGRERVIGFLKHNSELLGGNSPYRKCVDNPLSGEADRAAAVLRLIVYSQCDRFGL